MGDQRNGLSSDHGPGQENEKESINQKTQLTLEQIEKVEDIMGAMELAEEEDVDITGCESDREIKTRLKCHLNLIQQGNLKDKVSFEIFHYQ